MVPMSVSLFTQLAFGWAPSFPELMIIMIIALLLFGKRLPDVARSLGKGVIEFKKGLKGVEDDVSQAEHPAPKAAPYSQQDKASSDVSQPPRAP